MSVSSEWIKLGDSRNGNPVYYKKKEIYHLDWKINLEDYIIAVAKFGGPLALTKDPNKALIVTNSEDAIPYIFIYSASGLLISKFVVNFPFSHSSSTRDWFCQWAGRTMII
jgi:hypothetical protein